MVGWIFRVSIFWVVVGVEVRDVEAEEEAELVLPEVVPRDLNENFCFGCTAFFVVVSFSERDLTCYIFRKEFTRLVWMFCSFTYKYGLGVQGNESSSLFPLFVLTSAYFLWSYAGK